MQDIYENIRRLRIEQGMSQDELAQLVGYKNRASIAKIEAGETDIPLSKARLLASALKQSLLSLMGMEQENDFPSNRTYLCRRSAETTAAHLEGTEDLSDDELEDINRYIEFVKSRRK